ncbi:MmyB family transcriptional regulator [Streptomyces sp. GSL17-111]|uniref:MmyB family transcriptional regulator n=1 Tax=Streptomyces sp. GSL17-111 TaxID=3121596 RepID=UPI0030F39637
MGGSSGGALDAGTARSVRELLRAHRAERTLEDAHRAAVELGLDPPSVEQLRGRRRSRGVSQQQVATLLRYTERRYWEWESGRERMPAPVAQRVIALLGVDERAARWLLELLHPLPVPVGEPDPAWRALLHMVPAPAYLATVTTWEVVTANDAYHELFPWAAPWAPRPEPSIVRAVLLRPEARDVLLRWREDWAVPLVNIVWSTYQVHRDDPALRALVDELLGCPESAALWASREARVAAPALHQGMDRRGVRHPVKGEMEVVPLVSRPETLRSCRMVVLAPVEWGERAERWEALRPSLHG